MSAQGFGQPGMAEPRRAFNTSRLRNTARLYSRPALGCPGQRRRRAPGAERLHQLWQPPPRPHDLHTVECPVADVVGIGQDRHMRRRQPVPAGQRSPRYRRSPEHSLWAATVTRIPSREPSRSAGTRAFSLTSLVAQRDAGIGRWTLRGGRILLRPGGLGRGGRFRRGGPRHGLPGSGSLDNPGLVPISGRGFQIEDTGGIRIVLAGVPAACPSVRTSPEVSRMPIVYRERCRTV